MKKQQIKRCVYCGNYYFTNYSDAFVKYCYCSEKCEEKASEELLVEIKKRKEVKNEEN